VIGSRCTARAMNRTAAFFLLIQKGEAGAVVQLQVALDRPTFDKDGQALVTPAAATADTFEGAANALQAELDEMRCRTSVARPLPPSSIRARRNARPAKHVPFRIDRSSPWEASMKRAMATAVLALALSAGVAKADPGKDECGKGRERFAHELRFDRDEARGGRCYKGKRSRHAVRVF
jgi:hypothetical protein